MLKFQIFIFLPFLLLFSLYGQEKTNILLFTADDLHAESLGVYGGLPNDVTPNLDKFAKQGLQFNRAHVNVAICFPCRSVIATGLYSHNSGAMGFMHSRPDVPNVIDIMKEGGYYTGILGKQPHSTPKKSTKWDYAFDQRQLGNGRSPKLYFQRSKTFFKECKDKNKPFYFMVNSHDPHRPYCNPEKLLRGAEMPSKIYKAEDVHVPGFLPDLPGVRAEFAQYLNSTRRLDDVFGKVMQALEESGQAKNTLVIFISDNGVAFPFAKCNTWFHSSRTPFLARWPGVIKANQKNDKHFISTIDFLPTFLEISNIKGPNNLDGRSLVSVLKGESEEGRDYVYTMIDKKAGHAVVPMRAVQNSKYGYIYNAFNEKDRYRNNNEGKTMRAMEAAAETDKFIASRVKLFRHRIMEEFYDLEKDPNCLNNLVSHPEYKSIVASYRNKLVDNMKITKDPILEAFQNRNDRIKVDQVLLKVYGKPQVVQNKKKKKKLSRK